MLPILELRAAIPLGYGLGLPPLVNYLICVVGNLLPVPFILFFIRKILAWMKKVKKLEKIALWVEERAHRHSEKVLKYASIGLFLFVAVPLPGTGAWTGALVAALFDMRYRYSIPSIFFGGLTAGFLMVGICYGFLDSLLFLLF